MKLLYRLYTEDKPNLPSLVSQLFDGFTLQKGKGYWQGKPESSAIIEIITTERRKIAQLVQLIKDTNQQKSVIVIKLDPLGVEF